jgi:hypothetical protein
MAFIYDLTDTWNAGGVTFNAIKMNVTDTASAAASRLVSLQVGGVERFSVRKDGQGYFAGNVGIGTTAPVGRLGVAVTGSRTIGTAWDASSVLVGSPGQFSGNLGLSFDTTNGATLESAAPGVAAYPVRLVGSDVRFITVLTERMRIDSSGNVGIGLTNPSVRMEIVGASGFNPATQNTYAMWVANAGSANGDLAFGSSTTAAHIQSFNAKPLILNSAGNNVGINESAPDYKLDVNGTFGFTPGSSVTPVDNGDVVFELTDNTTLTIKAKGSDGVVRSGTIILV